MVDFFFSTNRLIGRIQKDEKGYIKLAVLEKLTLFLKQRVEDILLILLVKITLKLKRKYQTQKNL